MARSSSSCAARADRAGITIDQLDTETVRSAQTYLKTPTDRRTFTPHLFEPWDRFYDACDRRIHRLVDHWTPLSSTRDDRVQEIWQAVVCGLDQFDPDRGTFAAWLTAVALHVLHLRARARRPPDQLVDEVEDQLTSREADPAEAFELGTRRHRLDAALEQLRLRLPEPSYRIFHDHWINGVTFTDIASTTGVPVGRVRQRHLRAIQELRRIYSQLGDD